MDVVYGTSPVVAFWSALSTGLLGAARLGGAGMSSLLMLGGATYREKALVDLSFRLLNRGTDAELKFGCIKTW